MTFSFCMCNGNGPCSMLCIGGETCPVLGAVDEAISDVCMHSHNDYELPCSVITYRATSTYSQNEYLQTCIFQNAISVLFYFLLSYL